MMCSYITIEATDLCYNEPKLMQNSYKLLTPYMYCYFGWKQNIEWVILTPCDRAKFVKYFCAVNLCLLLCWAGDSWDSNRSTNVWNTFTVLLFLLLLREVFTWTVILYSFLLSTEVRSNTYWSSTRCISNCDIYMEQWQAYLIHYTGLLLNT